MIKCVKCQFEVSGTPAFCPNCGAPMAKKMSDEEISKLIFGRFGKKYDEALEEAYTACIYDIENQNLHKNLFLMRHFDLLRESEYQDEAIRRCIEKNKGDPRLKEALSHYKLGLIYENGKKFDDAGKEYGKALEAPLNFASALFRRGMVYEIRAARARARQWEVLPYGMLVDYALMDYQWAGQFDPQFPLAFFCLGRLLKQARNKKDDALANYFKCVALDPDCAAAHNNMGLIYVDKKDFASAEKEFNEVLKVFPGHPTATKNLELAKKRKGRGWGSIF
jgi:tetratricopeptide (TPR) repeat protein